MDECFEVSQDEMHARHNVRSWPKDGLEYLGRCPVCGARDREKLYGNLWDRLYGAPGLWELYRCECCGSGYLDPRPSKESVALAYEQYPTHEVSCDIDLSGLRRGQRLRLAMRNGYLNHKYGYVLRPSARWGYFAMHLLPPPLRLEWDHYARHLGVARPGQNRLLDVGCGNGEYMSRAKMAGWDVHGLDFDPKAASLAQLKGFDVWVGEYGGAPFKPESFDVITSNQVIEHVHDPADFIRQLASWLKPGGRLWIGTPNFTSWSHYLFGSDWKLLHPPQHLVLLSKNALMLLLHENGFKADLRPRGYFEAHVLAESSALRSGACNYIEMLKRKKTSRAIILEVMIELGAWMLPAYGSDLAVLGIKM